MNAKVTRRNLLSLGGGVAVGLAASPAPWRLVRDSAIWSQNWSWIPKVPHGEVTVRHTHCTLCPAACPVRARCSGDVPFALTGVPGHPSGSALCPVGLGGHQLPYHPGRIRQPLRGGTPIPWEQAAAAVRAAVASGEGVAVLDMRPGRSSSWAYRRHLARRGGTYIVPPAIEGATVRALARMVPGAHYGYDIARARTILSFGAPVLDGWGVPGRVSARVIQAEPRESRTAMLADEWIPIEPGSEAGLALGIASALLTEKLYDRAAEKASDFRAYAALAGRWTPQRAASVTGVPAERFVRLARELAGAPVLAVADGEPGAGPLGNEEETLIAGLNLLLAGALAPRSDVPVPAEWHDAAPVTELADVPGGSLRVLIVDESLPGDALPWNIVEPKLAPDAVVAVFSSSPRGFARHAGYTIPTPVFLESLEEVPVPVNAPVAALALAAPLVAPAPGLADPVAMITGEAGADIIKQRVAAIHNTGRGTVFTPADGKSTPLAEVKSPDELWKALNEGAAWLDEPGGPRAPGKFSLLGAAELGALERAAEGRLHANPPGPLVVVPSGWRGVTGTGLTPPLLTKIWQESDLREPASHAAVNPATALANGLTDGMQAHIESACGGCTVAVTVDETVMPGVLEVIAGGSLANVCAQPGACTWRLGRAKVVHV